ncbi:hypothetical protein IAU60_003257 [Kwoniella sp. DSM 27419]
MSDSTAQTVRQLKIKTGVVKRLFKEEGTYRQEVIDQTAVVKKMKDEDREGADIRAAERVLKDSETMVPHTQKQLAAAVESLEDLVNALQSEASIVETQEYKDAVQQLKQVQEQS